MKRESIKCIKPNQSKQELENVSYILPFFIFLFLFFAL